MQKAWLLAALVALGCEKTEEPKQEPAKPAEPPKTEAPKTTAPTMAKLTTADYMKKLDECNQAMSAKDDAKLMACYTDDAKVMIVDSGMEFTGPKQIVDELYKTWMAAWPDWKPNPQLVLSNGNKSVGVMQVTATNGGPLMGQKATNKKMSVIGARYIVMSDDGKIKEEWHFVDQASILGQIGLAKPPMKPRVDAKPLMDPPVMVTATDSKTENDNVATVAKMDEAYTKADTAGLVANLTDDFTMVDNTMPGEMKGKATAQKMLDEGAKAWTDRKWSSIDRFGAGDYVVSIGEMSSTNSGDMPSMKLKKTGKTVTMKTLMISHLTGGKIDKMWSFANGMAWYVQMGMMKPPAMPAPGAGAEAVGSEKMEKGAEGEKPEKMEKAEKKGKKPSEPSAKPAAPNE